MHKTSGTGGLPGVNAVVILYDITDRLSFDSAMTRAILSSDTIVMLNGHKSDLGNKRVVEYEEGSQYAKENGFLFMETSSRNGCNIDAMFQAIASAFLEESICAES